MIPKYKPIHIVNTVVSRLDPALIRPGRVDVKQLISHCSNHQLTQMYARFYPEATHKQAEDFALRIQAHTADTQGPLLSAAQVQGYFMFHKHSASDALNNIESIYDLVWPLLNN